MSAATLRLGRPRATARTEGGARAESGVLRVAAFAALGAFAAAHWGGLVSDPPLVRLCTAVALCTLLAMALSALPRLRAPRASIHALALALTLAAGALALGATALELRLLLPGNWDALGVELDRGFSGIRTVQWPYAGDDAPLRLVILLGAPALLVVSAALAFWPVRRGAGLLRALGLVALLVLYGTAVTEHDQGAPLLRGLALFGLVAAWLWLPRVNGRAVVPAALAVGAVAVLSLPVAARLDSDTAIVDYSSWNWFGGNDVTFDWNHSYGPLDWPREGTTLLNVRSDRALYWKAETLDSFDGFRWLRSGANDRAGPGAELPARPQRKWLRSFRVTVRSLKTDFVIGAGTPFAVDGAGEAVSGSADGTVRRLEQPLERGDSYTVRAYVPTPTRREMRAAPADYAPGLLQYTTIQLPSPGADATDSPPGRPVAVAGDRVQVPLTGDGTGDTAAARTLESSPYARTFRLSRRLTAGAPTVFDAVRRVEQHLQRGFDYSESPRRHRYPLEAFLFEERTGYCQQFSGAMALMLRMSGIPARVVSGFSPGSRNRDSGEYRVRDLDAHSWVEVHLAGIGWVTFDPTPSAAPADRAGQGPLASPLDRPRDGSASSGGGEGPQADAAGGAAGGQGKTDGGGGALPLALGTILLIAGVASAAVLRRRRRSPVSPTAASEARLEELRRALERLGWAVPAGTTLLALERRLGRAAGPASARYVAGLRQGRYSPRASPQPTRADRRALRRELAAPSGPLGRVRGLLALPPRSRVV